MKDLYASKSKRWYADTLKVTKYDLTLRIADLIELLKDEFGVIWEGPTNRKAPIHRAIQLLEHPEHPESVSATNKTVTDAEVQQTIDAVEASLEVVKEVSKKVTKAELKLQKRLELESLPAEVKWESDFMGEVWIGKEVREFWVTEPYENPVINLVTSNGTVILSIWDSTRSNPFVKAAVKEFYNLLLKRGEEKWQPQSQI